MLTRITVHPKSLHLGVRLVLDTFNDIHKTHGNDSIVDITECVMNPW